jgi:hypothetical protein
LSSYEITTRAVSEKREVSSAKERKKERKWKMREAGNEREYRLVEEMTNMPLFDSVELS